MLLLQKSEKGIALVQTLLISALISILLISMVRLTQQQQKQTIALMESARVDLELYSEASRLKFDLLTNYWTRSNQLLERENYKQNWNFFGRQFSRNGYNARLINIRSLVSLRGDTGTLATLIQQTSQKPIGKQKSLELARKIIQWQEPATTNNNEDNVLPLQHPIEMALLIDESESFMRGVFPFVQAYASSSTNPVYMPTALARVLYGRNTASKMREAQATGQLSANEFNRLTGMQLDELVGYSPGPEFRMVISPRSGRLKEVLDAKKKQRRYYAPLVMDVGVYPYAKEPIKTFFSSRAVSSYLLWENSVDE